MTLLSISWHANSWQEAVASISLMAVFGILLYFVRRSDDKSSIVENLRRQGAWFRRMSNHRTLEDGNHYQVHYRDRNGWEHTANCMVTKAGDVFYADDVVIETTSGAPPVAPAAVARPRPPENRIAELELENARLKRDLAASRSQSRR